MGKSEKTFILTYLSTDEKVSMAKFQTDPTIIPGVCGIESFEHKKTPHFPNFFEGYLVELSPDGLDPLAM